MALFSVRLNSRMQEKGYKQADVIRLANRIGEASGIHIGKSHMSQYCSGKTTPRADILSVLSKALGVNQLWLQGEEVAKEAIHPEAEAMPGAGGDVSSHEMPVSPESADFPDRAVSLPRTDVTLAKSCIADMPSKASLGKDSASELKENIFRPVGDDNIDRKNQGERKMREFKKSYKLNDVLYDVRGPVVDEANRMSDSGIHILKLNIGNPAPFGFRAPEEVIHDFRQQAVECEGYSDSKGLFSARKAIMQYAQLKHIPNVDINGIYTGNGASELINLCMQALLDDGDEILIPSPDYPLWTATATLAGGKPVHYLCDEQSEWYPDLEDMERKITDRTKALVIINPNNPTGALYPREILEKIVELARRHQLMIFSDEIYDRLIMDGEEHISIASLAPDLFCVTFSGLSKSHMIAGFRIGWMILSGNKRIAKDYIEGLNMLSNMRLCSNVPSQAIVQTALGGYQSVKNYTVPGGRVCEQRDYVYKALNDIPGITAVKPKGGFYIFPKIDIKKFNITNDEQFALDFLKEKHVLIVHGGGFNWKEPDHFRVVFLPRIEVLEEAMTSLEDFLRYYRQ